MDIISAMLDFLAAFFGSEGSNWQAREGSNWQ